MNAVSAYLGPEEESMRELHADRAETDGAHIIVIDLDSGDEFLVAVDDTLRALVHPPAEAPPAPTEDGDDGPEAAESGAVESGAVESESGSAESTDPQTDDTATVDSLTDDAPTDAAPTDDAQSADAADAPAPGAPEPAPATESAPVTALAAVPDRQAVTLTPREIQARVRAGATPEELAESTGVALDKISRFAHPVMLERSRAAELARASHPLGVDGPSAGTLGEVVAECLVLRGGSPQNAKWDAWRAASGQWVVQVSPDPGSGLFAHWRFVPGSHGGTTDPMDDLAVELSEPELARSRRRPTPPTIAAQASPRAADPPIREVTADGHELVTVNADDLTEDQQRRQREPFGDVLDLGYGDRRSAPEEREPTGPRHRGKRATPTVPAWEDVLLGVRSHPNE
ncbi:septation protein SepH [Gordonia aichiensis]|uniref:septation protein SepH n=1 Tax=Gordonia aichiensis TaxID=36820 RepID=UPI00326549FE